MSELPNPTLPDDIVTEILLRLPVKPICRFKCVSKPWQSLLSNPKFARAHLKLHIDDPEYFILTSSIPDFAPYILTFPASVAESSATKAGDVVARKVLLPSELKMKPVVAGSCDGLVLLVLQDAECSKILFNPITLETVKIMDNRGINDWCSYGFGYDSYSDDYKIVSLSDSDTIGSLLDVYSVKMKCWKRTMDSPHYLGGSIYEKDGPAPAAGVYLNGCIHWLGYDTRNGFNSLVCYDLAREEFEEGLFPFSIHGRFAFEIRVLEGCLALVSEPYLDNDGDGKVRIDVWVMRQYGVRDSWTKFATIDCSEECVNSVWMAYNVVCSLNEGEIVVERDSKQLLAYNRRNGMKRDFVIDGIPNGFHRVMPFRESLLSPIQ